MESSAPATVTPLRSAVKLVACTVGPSARGSLNGYAQFQHVGAAVYYCFDERFGRLHVRVADGDERRQGLPVLGGEGAHHAVDSVDSV